MWLILERELGFDVVNNYPDSRQYPKKLISYVR